MFSEYFNPVNIEIIDYADNLDNNQLGSKLKINGRDNLNFFDDLDVVIFSINEYRFNSSIQKSFNANKDFRKKLYSLYYGNWDLNIYDFGDLENGNKRIVLSLKPHLSPIKAAVIPLKRNNEDLVNKASKIKNDLQALGMGRVILENSGNIGKGYRRHDEIGTPICITVDFETIENDTVTIRDRDTMSQKRVSSQDLNLEYKKVFN